LPRPRYALGLAQPQQQLELLGEQLLVGVEVVAEQRERLDKRTAPGHDLGAPVRDEVERGEVLEDAHGIVGAQHRDRAGQADVPRARGGGSQRDGRRRDGVVGAVVLADAEDVEADLVGQHDLLEEVAHPPRRVDPGSHVGEGVQTELHRRFLSGRVRRTRTLENGLSIWRGRAIPPSASAKAAGRGEIEVASDFIMGFPRKGAGDPPVRNLHVGSGDRAFPEWSRGESNP
jgi:hypothetical protein